MLKYIAWTALALCLIIVGAVFVRSERNVSELPTQGILDSHTHIAGIGTHGSGAFVSSELRASYKFSIYLKAFGTTEVELREQGDAVVVARLAALVAASKWVDSAIVLALDGVVDGAGSLDRNRTQVFVPDDFVQKETAKYAHLHWGASINPYRHDALARLGWAKENGALLVKWIPSIQGIDPADDELISFYDRMRDLGLVLLTHTGQERSFGEAQDELADPVRLELPLKRGLTVVAAHVATTGVISGQENIDRLLPMFSRFTNLYADISSLTQVNKRGYLRRVLDSPETEGRLIYGSDYPLINTLLVSPLYFINELGYSELREIDGIDNPFDADVKLKQLLGVPAEIFEAGQSIFLRD